MHGQTSLGVLQASVHSLKQQPQSRPEAQHSVFTYAWIIASAVTVLLATPSRLACGATPSRWQLEAEPLAAPGRLPCGAKPSCWS